MLAPMQEKNEGMLFEIAWVCAQKITKDPWFEEPKCCMCTIIREEGVMKN